MRNIIFFLFLLVVHGLSYSQVKLQSTDIEEKYDKLHPDYYLLPKISHIEDIKKFCFYYCPPNTKAWLQDIYSTHAASIFLQATITGKGFFYGRKGYKYAYSFNGPDSKPIQLYILKKDNQWQIED